MKRGKDEEKTMGPMFPRLHVNDTEKGGPRAPPRNKMALYEQLSIPSQRFNSGIVPFNPKSVPPSSPAEGARSERSTFFPLQQPPSIHSAEGTTNNRFSNLNNQLAQQEHKKKQDEGDFRVPIFVQQSRISQTHSGNHRNRGLSNVENARQSTKVQKENSQDFVKSGTNQSMRQKAKDPLKETNGPSSFGHINASSNSKRSHSDGNIRGEGVENTLWGDSVLNEAMRATGNGDSSQQEVLRSPNDPTNGDADSETSMVDSICGVDISSDDVIGIIGQKHFWKARRAIVNQQRVFAVQVFELHRLLKVQRLIAGSPQLLGGDDKPPRVSPIKKIPLEYVVEPTLNGPKRAENEDREFSAENGSRTTACRPFPGGPFPGPDPKMGLWGYSQPAGHQWLIPVMSPSEGFVYKPYPGPGFVDPSCGPTGSMPVIGHNFPNYMVPPHHPHEPPTPTPTGPQPLPSHVYFPPYMMHQSVSGSGPHPTGPFNVPNEPVPNVTKFRARKDIKVQASTASSPGQKTALPLFPTSPRARVEPSPGPQRAEPARVIRVVPHNARSATASVARIFRSIQEERKQHDSV